MKKLLLLLLLTSLIYSCGGNKKPIYTEQEELTVKDIPPVIIDDTYNGDKRVIACVGAISEKKFEEMVRSISKGDKKTFDSMLLSGDLIDIPEGSCKIIKGGLSKCLIEFADSKGNIKRAYVHREFVE